MEISVLYGGDSTEREVSLVSGSRVCEALRERGHAVTPYELCDFSLSPDMCRVLKGSDAVFLAFHGGAGEDGSIQAELERQGILHYSGSGPNASALAMRKDLAKARVAMFGVPVAKGCVIGCGNGVPPDMKPPLVIKPRSGGSSVGLKFFHTAADAVRFCADEPLLCEQYLSGREYSVGILEGKALPPVEIRPRGGAYDYHHKYTPGATEEICPALLPSLASDYLKTLARVVYAALGLRDYARIDFRENASGTPHFLEANTLPGLTPTSLLPLAAGVMGISFSQLCERIAYLAAARRQ